MNEFVFIKCEMPIEMNNRLLKCGEKKTTSCTAGSVER